MLRNLFLFCIVVFAIPTPSQTVSIMVCNFQYDENNIYTCNMAIINSDGEENLQVTGNHLPNHGPNDVKRVIAIGTSTIVPPSICEEFSNLERMELQNIGIRELFLPSFWNCRQLRYLDLGYNEIPGLTPYTFFNTNRLEELYLDFNRLNYSNRYSFFGLGRLKILKLDNNPDIYLDSNIFEEMRNLTMLYLKKCSISTLNPAWFNDLQELQILELSENNIVEIPSNVFRNLQNLEWLNMTSCKISKIHEDSFENASNLKVIFLDSNEIQTLPENVFHSLRLLESLYLSENNFTSLPAHIFKFSVSLITLAMRSCNLREFKREWFASTCNLRTVLMELNQIQEIPDAAFSVVNRLRLLSLYNNQISVLSSKSFGSLEGLTHLDMRNNQLNAIDVNFINHATSLTVAGFSGNECTDLDTTNFSSNRAEHMQALNGCFNNYVDDLIILETLNSETFEWFDMNTANGYNSLNITIRATENAHIALQDVEDLPFLEIRIGQDGNQKSQILYQGNISFTDTVPNRLSPTDMRSFIIQWNSNFLGVQHGDEPFPFLVHFSPSRFEINIFGLRTQIQSSNVPALWNVRRLQRSTRSEHSLEWIMSH